jgi:hypothetical protein
VNLTELKRVAMAATQGPVLPGTPNDIDYIDTFRPVTVLKLIEVIEKAAALREAMGGTTIMPSNHVEGPLAAFDAAMDGVTWRTLE